jgi:gliding motility-associated lipoprotein GldB
MKKLLVLLSVIISVFSCKNESELELNIAKKNTDISIERFETLFAEAHPEGLQLLKASYPFMLSEKYSDSFWIAKMADTLQNQLFNEIQKVFPTVDTQEKQIESLFNHLSYYFPEFQTPRIISSTSYVDYRNKIIVTDTIAIIALDTYLGSDHEFYGSIPKYIRQNLQKEQIVPDMTMAYAEKYIFPTQNKTLLDEMIYYGKSLYFKDIMIPFVPEETRIGYTASQLKWAQTNESYIWRYFVERELLFSTDSKLPGRFIASAPFTKFYLEEIDADSPGRLGQYIGWQIVRAYMDQNDVSIKDMLITSPEKIFNNSKFKPRK